MMTPDRFQELCLELAGISGELRELVELVAGDAEAIPQTIKIDATRNPWCWKSKGGLFHAIKIDNPTAAAVAVAFHSGGGALRGNGGADEIVNAGKGRVITRPFEVVEIGFDPATVPAGVSTLFVTIYARQMQPTTYVL